MLVCSRKRPEQMGDGKVRVGVFIENGSEFYRFINIGKFIFIRVMSYPRLFPLNIIHNALIVQEKN